MLTLSLRLTCRGEAYWPRAALSELHTAEQWRVQLGREVVADQLERPVKLVPKRGYKPDAVDLEVRCIQMASSVMVAGWSSTLRSNFLQECCSATLMKGDVYSS